MLSVALYLLPLQTSASADLLDDVAPACVQIRSYGKTMSAGTGFVFGARNVVVTSARVVAGASRNVIIDRAGNAHRAIGMVKDVPNDIAVLLLDNDLSCTPFSAASSEPVAGTSVHLVGYPLDRPEISLATGTISVVKSPAAFAISTPIRAGASGAAIVGAGGELLGMASRTEGGANLAVASSVIAAAVRRTSDVSVAPAAPKKAPVPVTDDSDTVVDDPNDANGEFAPYREAIEIARRREADKTAPLPAEPPAVRVEDKVEAVAKVSDPRAENSVAFARFWGDLHDRKARWYVAPAAEADARLAELLDFVRDPAHGTVLTASGLVEAREWERALIVLESEIEELELERADPLRLVDADERLVARLQRRLWTNGLAAKLDTKSFGDALTPTASVAPLFARFRAMADPAATGAVVALSANPELHPGDEITALVVDGGTPIPVRSLGELAASARTEGIKPESTNVALLVRRAGRTVLVGQPAR